MRNVKGIYLIQPDILDLISVANSDVISYFGFVELAFH